MSKDETQLENDTDAKYSGPGYLEVIIIAIMMAAFVVMGYDRFFAHKIQVLDLKRYLRTQKALLAAGEITQQQWKVKLDNLEQVLDAAAAGNKNHVIVLKDVVLRNGDEINIKE